MSPGYPAIHIGTRTAAFGLTVWNVVEALSREDASAIQFAAGAVAGAIVSLIAEKRTIREAYGPGLAARRNCVFLSLSGILPSGMRVDSWLSKYLLNSFVAGFQGGFVAGQFIFPFAGPVGNQIYSEGIWKW
ncbi:MAG: hypothetical protein JSR46_08255 [Verrucomicrobia bacterium]|nr:hypothetical protein [Verrucomicrobiota bacterium]